MGGRETPLPLANGEAYNLAAGRRGDELNSLWESIENSIHTSKTLLTEKIRRDAKSAGSWHTGADIDRWTSKQSVMIMNVLRMLNDKPADEPGSAKKTAKKKRTCR